MSTDKLADQRQHQSEGGWQGWVLPPRRADDPPAQRRLQTAGRGGQRLELQDGTHLGPGCRRLEVSLPRGGVTRGDLLSPRQASDCLLPALQPLTSSGAQGLSSPFLPRDSCRGHGDTEDMGLEAATGPCPRIYRGTRAWSTALGPHPQVRSLCPDGRPQTGQPGQPWQVNLWCRPLGSGRGRMTPSGEDFPPLKELLSACSWASAETTRA